MEHKKITKHLRCLLNDNEKIEAGKQLADATESLRELEEDKAQIVAEFKAKTTAAQALVAILSNKLRSGYEYRDVECAVILNTPQDGHKQVVRTDTNEIVEALLMTEEEKQGELELSQE